MMNFLGKKPAWRRILVKSLNFSLLAGRAKTISYEGHLHIAVSWQWTSTTLTFSLKLYTAHSTTKEAIFCSLPWILLLVYAPSPGLLLQYMVTTSLGLPSQKASQLITPHTPELSAVSFPRRLPRTSDELDLQKSELLSLQLTAVQSSSV